MELGEGNGMEWKKKAYNLFREFLYAMLMSCPLIFRKVFGLTCFVVLVGVGGRSQG
jgi:hypothetical protein